MNNKPSFLILTLGCKLNQLESESLTDAFLKSGFISAIDSEQFEAGKPSPSIIIINTCTVTSKADQKARRVIRKTLRDYPDSCVIVTGCYAQLNRNDLLDLDLGEKQRLFVINKNIIPDLPDNIKKTSDFCDAVGKWETIISHSSFSISNSFKFNPQRFSGHTRSFLKIQDGCYKHCTYCRIRLARGQSVSLDADEALARLRLLEENHAEAVLTGVNISQYKAGDWGLAELLDYLLNNTKRIAIRLSSLAPDSIDEKLAQILSHKRIRPHFHLSVQSGSKKILEKMGRGYNSETIEKAVSLLRKVKDDPFLACDIIAGFPGETDVEFKQTFNLCRKLDFAWIHVFPYSKRPGTPAFLFKDNVTESEVSKRVQLFTCLAKQGKAEYVRRWLGREVDVLVENRKQRTVNREIAAFGTAENYLKVLVRQTQMFSSGSVLSCKLTGAADNDSYDVMAAPVSCSIQITD